MPRRHERRKVLQPVPVQAPHERADDLTESRDSDDCERLETDGRRLEGEEHREDADREQSERQLSRVTDLPIDDEPTDGPGSDDEERDERKAAH